MRAGFAHDAVLHLDACATTAAPGAAITVALCGSWEHRPPCPLSPHHTQVERARGELVVRTLFAVEPELEDVVGQLIDGALASGCLTGPDGATSTWQLRSSGSGVAGAAERDHLQRLIDA